jgi:signal transduction histidine kinase/ActR/RegA family two-component response regulator
MKIRLSPIFLAAAASAALLMASAQSEAGETIKVGVYQNMPLTFVEPDGSAEGFFIDILEHIAAKEGWKIEYDSDSWSECLRKIMKGETDLLGVIAYSVERNRSIDYTYESVLTEWGQIYTSSDSGIESILDLRDKKIAVLQADMHFLNLKRLMNQFGIPCRYIEAFEYEDVLMLTELGICDAGLVSQFYGAQYERYYDIGKSAIILSPQKLYWAAAKDKNPEVLLTLDLHLRRLKKDENSYYYQALNKWFGVDTDSPYTVWIKWFGIGAGAVLLLFISASLVLRSQVKVRTRELSAKTEALEAEIQQREQAEKDREQLEIKLQRARKMEALGTLAGGVAHDLNNILSGLVSYPELMLMDLPEDSPLQRPIQTMKGSGEKAAAIVQDLLTLARRGVAVTEVVCLNRIVREYLVSFEFKKLQTDYPTVRFETVLAKDLLPISGSPVHLSKTLMNLVSNAAEAIDGFGHVNIETESRYVDRPISGYDDVQQGDYAVLSVTDDGIGISSDDTERIFEPFYTKKVMGRSGSGLGMAVVWGTVKDHQGYIDVQSTKGRGTRFTLYFPAVREELAVPKPESTLADLTGNGERILVVDDVRQQRQIASDMLERLGYNVAAAESGEEAVAYLRRHAVDLLVLDMIMEPGIDGLETYRQALTIHPGQKAIIASGFSETQRVKEAQRLGAGMYVKKPYTLEKIGQAVRDQLDDR